MIELNGGNKEELMDFSNIFNHITFCVTIDRIDKKISYFLFLYKFLDKDIRLQLKLEKFEELLRKIMKNYDKRIEWSKYYTIVLDNDEAKIVFDLSQEDEYYTFGEQFFITIYELDLKINDYLGLIMLLLKNKSGTKGVMTVDELIKDL